MSKRSTTISIVTRSIAVIAILGGASAVFLVLFVSRPQPAMSDTADALPSVTVFESRPVAVSRQWRGFGTARAMDAADVPARVTATVTHVPDDVLDGKRVRAGDLLVQLDSSDFLRQVEISEQNIADIDAQLERLSTEEKATKERASLAADAVEIAQREFDRVESAHKREVAKDREVDQARQTLIGAMRDEVAAREAFDGISARRMSLNAQKQAQELNKRLAQIDVDRCEIVAPIGGVLQTVDVKIGESVASGERVARVVNLNELEIPIRLPGSARSSVRQGDQIMLRSGGGSDFTMWTTLARISPDDDVQKRTMTVYAQVSSEDNSGFIAPGTFITASVLGQRVEQRTIVPRRSVRNGRIRIVESGVVRAIPVEIDYQLETSVPESGLRDTQWLVLNESLTPGTLVVADAARRIAVGTQVDATIAGDAQASAEGDR